MSIKTCFNGKYFLVREIENWSIFFLYNSLIQLPNNFDRKPIVLKNDLFYLTLIKCNHAKQVTFGQYNSKENPFLFYTNKDRVFFLRATESSITTEFYFCPYETNIPVILIGFIDKIFSCGFSSLVMIAHLHFLWLSLKEN